MGRTISSYLIAALFSLTYFFHLLTRGHTAVVQVSNPFDPYRLECPHKFAIVKLTMQRVESVGGARNDTMIASFCENIAKLYPSRRDEISPADEENCRWTQTVQIPGFNFGFNEICGKKEFIAGISRQEEMQYGFLCCKLKDRKRKRCYANRYSLPTKTEPEVAIEREQLLLSSLAYQDTYLIAQFCDYATMNQDEIDEEIIRESKSKLAVWFASQTSTRAPPSQNRQNFVSTELPEAENDIGRPTLFPGDPGDGDENNNNNFLPFLIPRNKNEIAPRGGAFPAGHTHAPHTQRTIGVKSVDPKSPVRYTLTPEEAAALAFTPSAEEERNRVTLLSLLQQRASLSEVLGKRFPTATTRKRASFDFRNATTSGSPSSTDAPGDDFSLNPWDIFEEFATTALPIVQQRASVASLLNKVVTKKPQTTTKSASTIAITSEEVGDVTEHPDEEGDSTDAADPFASVRASLSKLINQMIPTRSSTASTTTTTEFVEEPVDENDLNDENSVTIGNAFIQHRESLAQILGKAITAKSKPQTTPTATPTTTESVEEPVDESDLNDENSVTIGDAFIQHRASFGQFLGKIITTKSKPRTTVSVTATTDESVEEPDDENVDLNDKNSATKGNKFVQHRESLAEILGKAVSVKSKPQTTVTVTPTTTTTESAEEHDDESDLNDENSVKKGNAFVQHRESLSQILGKAVTAKSKTQTTPTATPTTTESVEEHIDESDLNDENSVTKGNAFIQHRASLSQFLGKVITTKSKPQTTVSVTPTTTESVEEPTDENDLNDENSVTKGNAFIQQRASLGRFLGKAIATKSKPHISPTTPTTTESVEDPGDESDLNDENSVTKGNAFIQQRATLGQFLGKAIATKSKPRTTPTTTEFVESVDDSDVNDENSATKANSFVRQRASVVQFLGKAVITKAKSRTTPATTLLTTEFDENIDESEPNGDSSATDDTLDHRRASLGQFLGKALTTKLKAQRTTATSSTTELVETTDETDLEDNSVTKSNGAFLQQRASLAQFLGKALTTKSKLRTTHSPSSTTEFIEPVDENDLNDENSATKGNAAFFQQRASLGQFLGKVVTSKPKPKTTPSATPTTTEFEEVTVEDEENAATEQNALAIQRASLAVLIGKTKNSRITKTPPQKSPENSATNEPAFEEEKSKEQQQTKVTLDPISKQLSSLAAFLHMVFPTTPPTPQIDVTESATKNVSSKKPKSSRRQSTSTQSPTTIASEPVVELEIATDKGDIEKDGKSTATPAGTKRGKTTRKSSMTKSSRQHKKPKKTTPTEASTESGPPERDASEEATTLGLIKVRNGKGHSQSTRRPRPTTTSTVASTTITTEKNPDIVEINVDFKQGSDELITENALGQNSVPKNLASQRLPDEKTSNKKPSQKEQETIEVTLIPDPPAVVVVGPDYELSPSALKSQNNFLIKSVALARSRVHDKQTGEEISAIDYEVINFSTTPSIPEERVAENPDEIPSTLTTPNFIKISPSNNVVIQQNTIVTEPITPNVITDNGQIGSETLSPALPPAESSTQFLLQDSTTQKLSASIEPITQNIITDTGLSESETLSPTLSPLDRSSQLLFQDFTTQKLSESIEPITPNVITDNGQIESETLSLTLSPLERSTQFLLQDSTTQKLSASIEPITQNVITDNGLSESETLSPTLSPLERSTQFLLQDSTTQKLSESIEPITPNVITDNGQTESEALLPTLSFESSTQFLLQDSTPETLSPTISLNLITPFLLQDSSVEQGNVVGSEIPELSSPQINNLELITSPIPQIQFTDLNPPFENNPLFTDLPETSVLTASTEPLYIDGETNLAEKQLKNQSEILDKKANDYYYYYYYEGSEPEAGFSRPLVRITQKPPSTTETVSTTETSTNNTSIFCNSKLAATEHTSGLVVACGKGSTVWAPPRCPKETFCMESSDTIYRICCPALFVN